MDATLRAGRAAGLSWKEIARRVGMGRRTTSDRAKVLDVYDAARVPVAPPSAAQLPGWMEAWAVRAGAAPERAVESPRALYAFHPICIAALDRVFDQSRFAE